MNSFSKARQRYSLKDPECISAQKGEWDFACEWRQRRVRISDFGSIEVLDQLSYITRYTLS